MADPKGTYFGPGERGLATILPGSPNFAGLVQSAQTANLRREKMAQDAAAKRQKERDAAVNSVYSALSKPHTTALIYQNSLNEKTFGELDKLKEVALSDANAADVRAFGAASAQDLVSYATAGKQVSGLIDEMRKWNQANGKMIDEGKLMKSVSDRILVDADGKLKDPRDISPDELSIENIVYGDKDGAGAEYLIKGEVIKNLLKKDELKAAVVENKDFTRATDLPTGKVGFEETRTKTKLQPFADINPVTGKVEIMDAERLVDSPVFQVLMNDRAFATLVENEVTRLYAPKDSPDSVYIAGAFGGTREVPLNKKGRASQDELDFLRAKAAVSLLNGTQLGGSEVFEERKVRMQNRFQPRSNNKPTVEQQKYAGEERWMNYVSSGDASKINQALAFTEAKGEANMLVDTAFDEKVDRVEATNDGFIFKIAKVRKDGTPRRDADGNLIYRIESVPISEIDPEQLRNFYRLAAFKSKRNFGTSERGEESKPEEPIFVNPKINK